jgi:putative membrane protein insertion efficiency factor
MMRRLLAMLVRGYRWFLSPMKIFLFGPGCGCRHVPSCSAYAEEALMRHGVVRGGWMTVCRLGRCHPWGSSGWDPVPGGVNRGAGAVGGGAARAVGGPVGGEGMGWEAGVVRLK